MFLPLSNGHTMYYEIHGAKTGPTAVVLHGGPGAGMTRRSLRMFNLRRWRVILYDQRGCGRSTPFGVASLAHNTTQDLLDDMERLRKAVSVEAWYLTGGSWGSTLALLYGEAHPKRVLGMLLRAVCLMDATESEWLYESKGAAQVFPDAYERFLSVVPPAQRNGTMNTLLTAYQTLLTSPDPRVRDTAAAAWTGYEDSVISLIPKPPVYKGRRDLSVAILENHYFKHGAWLAADQIVKNAHRLKHIPIDVIHGRYDMICPYRSIQTLSEILPKMHVLRVDDGGHSGYFDVEADYVRRLTDVAAGVRRASRSHPSRAHKRHPRSTSISKRKTRKRETV